MKCVFCLIWLLSFICSLAALDIAEWSNIRIMGEDQPARIVVMAEIASASPGVNKVLYRSEAGIVEIDFGPGLAARSHQAVLPWAEKGYIGLRRSLANGKNHCVPLFYEGKALPGLAQLNRVSVDERNDVNTDHYDLVADYLTHSATRIFSAIQNRGGGFPTSLSFGAVYPSYMSVIANPADDPEDPRVIVWALVYIKVPPGGLSPGLYRIQNKNLTRIGDIQYQILADSNLLVMSCNKADLLADPAFAAWYKPGNPVFGFKSIINRTTIIPFATRVQDESPGSNIYPVPLKVRLKDNSKPVSPQILRSGTK